MKPDLLLAPDQSITIRADNGSERFRHALEQFWLSQKNSQRHKHQDPAAPADHPIFTRTRASATSL